jgi:lysophospholipase L1-like esterase
LNTSQSPHWFKRVFFVSLALNLVFIFFFGYTIHRRGGSAYLIKRTKLIFSKNKNSEPSLKLDSLPIIQRPVYKHVKSLFEILPDTDREIIFLGDSITSWCQWTELFQNPRIKNRGIGGDETDGILFRLDEILSSSPDKIFIMIGINDLARGTDFRDVFKNYKLIIQRISEKSPGTKIYIQSLLPVNRELLGKYYPGSKITGENIRKLNESLGDLSSKFQLNYIDLYSLFKGDGDQLDERFTYDGLHLNGSGYLIWKSAIERYVLY